MGRQDWRRIRITLNDHDWPAWVSAIVIIPGSAVFGITLITRSRSFGGPGFRLNLALASPTMWGSLMIGTAAIFALVLALDRAAAWVTAAATLLLFWFWGILVLASSWGDPGGTFPIASWILASACSLVIARRMLRARFEP